MGAPGPPPEEGEAMNEHTGALWGGGETVYVGGERVPAQERGAEWLTVES